MSHAGGQPRDSFASKFGVMVAAAGSAVGLGNIWKFPYVAGQNGGGAFIIIYALCILALGIPVMVAEFAIGRKGQANASDSFERTAPGTPWKYVGLLGIITAFLIMAFYTVVGGWTLDYIVESFRSNPEGPFAASESYFGGFIADTWGPIFWQVAFMALTAGVVLMGVSGGIEKVSKVMMPMLFVLIIVLCIRAVTLPGSGEGLRFLFAPDFSKVTWGTVLAALGQTFFSLSLGMGALITYGSYVKKEVKMVTTTVQVVTTDALIALLSGVMVLAAVFAFGVEPQAGPSLVFVTLPGIFDSMVGGRIFAAVFFILVLLAALTSSISLLEVVVSYCTEKFKMNRKGATIVVSILMMACGIPACLSMGGSEVVASWTVGGKNLFDLLDFVTSNIFLTTGGLFIVLFVGWGPGRRFFMDEITNGGTLRGSQYIVLNGLLRYVVPVLLFVVLVFGLI